MSETNWFNGAAYAARLGAQAKVREAAQAAQKGAEVLCDLAGSWDQRAEVM